MPIAPADHDQLPCSTATAPNKTPTPTSTSTTRNQQNANANDVTATTMAWLHALDKVTLETIDDNNGNTDGTAVLQPPRASSSSSPPPPLFVRPCYRVLFVLVTTFLSNALEPLDVVLTGSHGVGKRTFLRYVLFRLRRPSSTDAPPPPTIVLDVPSCFVCVASDGTIRCGDRRTSFREELRDSATVYLCDAASDPATEPLQGHDVHAQTLVVLPPVRDREDAFKRESQRVTFVLPPWTASELAACRASCYPHVSLAEFSQRRDMWGGLVRWVLAEPAAVAHAQFTRALAQLTLSTAAALIEKRGYVDSTCDATCSDAQSLIAMHVEANDTFQLRDATLCSTRVSAALVADAPSSEHVVRFLHAHRGRFRLRGLLDEIEQQLLGLLLAV